MKYALFFAAIAVFAQPPEAVPVSRDPVERERALGARMAADYRSRTTLPDAPEVNAYLNELGHRFAPAHYTFELVDEDRTFYHEPASFPGGAIFVPAALVAAARDENELAGMLAHAVEHLQHPVTTTGKAGLATVPLTFMPGMTGYAPSSFYSPVPLSLLPQLRAAELEADRAAAGMLATAGFDPSALYRYLDRTVPSTPPTGYFAGKSPYPPKSERLQALQDAIAQLPAVDYSAHPIPNSVRGAVTQILKRPDRPRPTLRRVQEGDAPSLRK